MWNGSERSESLQIDRWKPPGYKNLCPSSTLHLRVGIYACEFYCPSKVFCSILLWLLIRSSQVSIQLKNNIWNSVCAFSFQVMTDIQWPLHISVESVITCTLAVTTGSCLSNEPIVAVVLDLLGEKITLGCCQLQAQGQDGNIIRKLDEAKKEEIRCKKRKD